MYNLWVCVVHPRNQLFEQAFSYDEYGELSLTIYTSPTNIRQPTAIEIAMIGKLTLANSWLFT